MTEEQAQAIIDKMIEIYPDLPNIEHEPIQFAHHVKMFKYFHAAELSSIMGE